MKILTKFTTREQKPRKTKRKTRNEEMRTYGTITED